MARKLIVEIVGDTRALEKSYRSAERGTKRFGQSMEKAGRGARVSSVAYVGLGRSVALASAAFLGGRGLKDALVSTVAAAEEAQTSQAQLRAALDTVGISFRDNRKAIDERTQALSQMSGFDDELITQTFTSLVRSTGDVSKALRLNAIAVDVARGRNISLESATQLVTKASLGMAGSLRRVGIAAQAGASATELLDLLQRKFAGSAEAYGKTAAGAQERFQVALENTQEVIGAALLPSLTKVLDKATEWLNNQENQKRIQRDVNKTVGVTATVLGDVASAIGTVKSAWDKLPDFGKDKGLVGLAAGLSNTNDEFERFIANAKILASTPTIGQAISKAFAAQTGTSPDFYLFGGKPRGSTVPGKVSGQSFLGFPVTAAQRRAIALAQTAGTGGPAEVAAINAQLAADNRAIAFARKGMASGLNRKKFAADLISLLTDQRSQLDRLAAISDQNAQKAKDARDKIKAANEARRQALLDLIGEGAHGSASVAGLQSLITARIRRLGAPAREQAKVFQLLGLTAAGDTRGPSQGNLQAALKNAQTAVAGGPLDSKAMQSKLAGLRTVINSEFGKLTRDTKQKIGEFLDALSGKKTGGPATPQRAASISQLIAGTGISGAGRRQLEFNIAGAHLTTPIVVHTHVNLDEREVGRSVTTFQKRDQRRRPTQTRGRPLP